MVSTLAWAGVFAFVLLDDTLELHERWGVALTDGLGLAGRWGVRDQDAGELLVWAAAGALLFTGVLAAYRGAGVLERAWSRRMLALFALLVFFGGVLDVLHGRWTDERLAELFALHGLALGLSGLELLRALGDGLHSTVFPAVSALAAVLGGELLGAVSGVLTYLLGLVRRL